VITKLSEHGPGRRPIDAIISPFQAFTKTQTSGGLLLLVFTVIALMWANSPWSASYSHFWHMPFAVGFGEHVLTKPLEFWINDGLMAVFFFVVGLEIKRESLTGELSSPRHAALPIAAALGGMVVPALLYFTFNAGTPEVSGWGIPMATDIAFALGVLALVGRNIPDGLKLFLTALAIVDDLGAVLVIAIFYTSDISLPALGIGFGFLLLMVLANILGVRDPLVYLVLGCGLWFSFLVSGVHATIAGVLGALAIPARSLIDTRVFVEGGRFLLSVVETKTAPGQEVAGYATKRGAIQALESACATVDTPLERLEHALHPWVAFFIMPVFALCNAGVVLDVGLLEALREPVTLGVMVGLIFGKQTGILLFSWLAVRGGLASLPNGVGWRQIYGAAVLGGIGFTMSLFIAGLAFTDPNALVLAKTGILLGSCISGGLGFWLLRNMSAAAKAQSSISEEESAAVL
jgi:NhaA family Na+:H+ antiporter